MTAPPVMAPGQDFSKGWRLRNSGTCTWEADYAIAYVNGNRPEAQMGGVPTAVDHKVAPGETVDISVDLRAPQVYGTFQGFWQMRNSQNQYFGEVVWVGIQVPDPNPPPPPPPPPASQADPEPARRQQLHQPGPVYDHSLGHRRHHGGLLCRERRRVGRGRP